MSGEMSVKELSNGYNVRLDDDLNVVDLVTSIQEDGGIKEPIAIFRKNGEWHIKNGHRRFAAALVLGLETVPVVEVSTPADDAEEVVDQLVMNIVRKPLSYLDVAHAYQTLKVKCGWTQAQIAKKFHVTEAQVSLALSMLKAHPKIKQAVVDGRVLPSAVEPLLPLPLEDQERLADAAIHAKTVRKVADLVRTDTRAQQCKASKKKAAAVANDVPDDVDPIEVLTLSALEDAVAQLELVEATRLVHPELVQRGRLKVRELVRTANRLQQALDN